MITRYSRPSMENHWKGDTRKFKLWGQSLIAILWALFKTGKVSEESFIAIRDHLDIDPNQARELDKIFGHDAQAAIEAGKESLRAKEVAENIIALTGWKLTSYDMEDPAFARLICEACDLIIKAIEDLIFEMKIRASQYKQTPCVFLTHGQVATPGYLGLRICRWIDALQRDINRIRIARDQMNIGKFSGATGIYDEVTPEEERLACEYLGLEVATGTSQIIHRDIHATVMAMLVICSRNVSQIANDLWHMCEYPRSEAREYFSPTQRGSSAMPHKKNPIKTEQIRGLSSTMTGYLVAAIEQVITFDERAIDQSSTERIIWPDATILLHYMLESLAENIKKFTFFPAKMKENLDYVQGLWASQYVKNALWEKGVTHLPFPVYRNNSLTTELQPTYAWVQSCAFQSWNRELNKPVQAFRLVLELHGIEEYLSEEELDRCFDFDYVLRHADIIYARYGIE